MKSWSVQVAKWRGVPIRLHASTPVGLLLFAGTSPIGWAAFLGLILLHELGHAAVVLAVGGRPTEVMLHGFGGHCAWSGDVTPIARAAIAWGGVAAQLVLLMGALTFWAFDLVPLEFQYSELWYRLVFSNAWLIGLNLVPISPLDGAEAWSLPYLLGQRARRGRAVSSSVTEAEARAVAARLLNDARRGDE